LEISAMAESTQHKLDRVRRPRVHLTYDVQIGDAIELKELPFVVGVLADLSGKPAEALPKLKTASSSRSTATTSTRSWPASGLAWPSRSTTSSRTTARS
jgi:hypothetical protein